MRFAFFCLLIATVGAGAALPQSTAKKTTSSAKKTSARKRAKTVAAAVPYRQQSPTPDRYREIQQALVDKGYLKSEPNGVWDTQSSDAMKQFQTEKNLPATGKITSASLIGLGLGPKPATSSPVIDPAIPAASTPATPAP